MSNVGSWTPSDDEQITMTEDAISHLRKMLKKHGGGLGMRLGIKTTGCNGYQYVVDYVDAASEQDRIFKQTDDLAVFVAEDVWDVVKGTQIDYKKQGLNETFVFLNPQATSECGCGESFGLG